MKIRVDGEVFETGDDTPEVFLAKLRQDTSTGNVNSGPLKGIQNLGTRLDMGLDAAGESLLQDDIPGVRGGIGELARLKSQRGINPLDVIASKNAASAAGLDPNARSAMENFERQRAVKAQSLSPDAMKDLQNPGFSPGNVLGMLAESAPSVVPTMMASTLGKGEIAQKAIGGGAEGVMSANQTKQGAMQQVMQFAADNPEKFAASKSGAQALNMYKGDIEKAIQKVVEDKMAVIGPLNTLGVAAMGQIGGATAERLMGRQAGEKIIKEILSEGLEEGLQSGLVENTAQNLVTGSVDPSVNPLDNIISSTALGALTGAAGGGAFGLAGKATRLGRGRNDVEEQAPIDGADVSSGGETAGPGAPMASVGPAGVSPPTEEPKTQQDGEPYNQTADAVDRDEMARFRAMAQAQGVDLSNATDEELASDTESMDAFREIEAVKGQQEPEEAPDDQIAGELQSNLDELKPAEDAVQPEIPGAKREFEPIPLYRHVAGDAETLKEMFPNIEADAGEKTKALLPYFLQEQSFATPPDEEAKPDGYGLKVTDTLPNGTQKVHYVDTGAESLDQAKEHAGQTTPAPDKSPQAQADRLVQWLSGKANLDANTTPLPAPQAPVAAVPPSPTATTQEALDRFRADQDAMAAVRRPATPPKPKTELKQQPALPQETLAKKTPVKVERPLVQGKTNAAKDTEAEFAADRLAEEREVERKEKNKALAAQQEARSAAKAAITGLDLNHPTSLAWASRQFDNFIKPSWSDSKKAQVSKIFQEEYERAKTKQATIQAESSADIGSSKDLVQSVKNSMRINKEPPKAPEVKVAEPEPINTKEIKNYSAKARRAKIAAAKAKLQSPPEAVGGAVIEQKAKEPVKQESKPAKEKKPKAEPKQEAKPKRSPEEVKAARDEGLKKAHEINANLRAARAAVAREIVSQSDSLEDAVAKAESHPAADTPPRVKLLRGAVKRAWQEIHAALDAKPKVSSQEGKADASAVEEEVDDTPLKGVSDVFEPDEKTLAGTFTHSNMREVLEELGEADTKAALDTLKLKDLRLIIKEQGLEAPGMKPGVSKDSSVAYIMAALNEAPKAEAPSTPKEKPVGDGSSFNKYTVQETPSDVADRMSALTQRLDLEGESYTIGTNDEGFQYVDFGGVRKTFKPQWLASTAPGSRPETKDTRPSVDTRPGVEQAGVRNFVDRAWADLIKGKNPEDAEFPGQVKAAFDEKLKAERAANPGIWNKMRVSLAKAVLSERIASVDHAPGSDERGVYKAGVDAADADLRAQAHHLRSIANINGWTPKQLETLSSLIDSELAKSGIPAKAVVGRSGYEMGAGIAKREGLSAKEAAEVASKARGTLAVSRWSRDAQGKLVGSIGVSVRALNGVTSAKGALRALQTALSEEFMHSARRLGVFNGKPWKKLVAAAKVRTLNAKEARAISFRDGWSYVPYTGKTFYEIAQAEYGDMGGDYTQNSMIEEEAVAKMFQVAAAKRIIADKLDSVTGHGLNKLLHFMRMLARVGKRLIGSGKQLSEDMERKLRSGKYASKMLKGVRRGNHGTTFSKLTGDVNEEEFKAKVTKAQQVLATSIPDPDRLADRTDQVGRSIPQEVRARRRAVVKQDILPVCDIKLRNAGDGVLGRYIYAELDTPASLMSSTWDDALNIHWQERINFPGRNDTYLGLKMPSDGKYPGLHVAFWKVNPNLIGTGVGKFMLRRAIDWAHSRGQRVYTDSIMSQYAMAAFEGVRNDGYEVIQAATDVNMSPQEHGADRGALWYDSPSETPLFEIRRGSAGDYAHAPSFGPLRVDGEPLVSKVDQLRKQSTTQFATLPLSKPKDAKDIRAFIKGPVRNSWIYNSGGYDYYVRKGVQAINGQMVDTFDLANIVRSDKKGSSVAGQRAAKGRFRAFMNNLELEVKNDKSLQGIYVENVMNPFLPEVLNSMGYNQADNYGFTNTPSFYKPISEIKQSSYMFATTPGANTKKLKQFEAHPETGKKISLMQGKFGPYVTDGTNRAQVPEGEDLENMTFVRALELHTGAKPTSTRRFGKAIAEHSTKVLPWVRGYMQDLDELAAEKAALPTKTVRTPFGEKTIQDKSLKNGWSPTGAFTGVFDTIDKDAEGVLKSMRDEIVLKNPFFNWISKQWIPLGGLESKADYLWLRRLLQGRIARIEEKSSKLAQAIANIEMLEKVKSDPIAAAKDLMNGRGLKDDGSQDRIAAIKEYLLAPNEAEENAALDKIGNDQYIALAKEVKDAIEDVTNTLEEHEVISHEQAEKNRRNYLRIAYHEHLDTYGKSVGIAASGAAYRKSRKDIPYDRQLTKGKIEYTPLLVYLSTAEPMVDVAKFTFFNAVMSHALDNNLNWVLPNSLVKFGGKVMSRFALAQHYENAMNQLGRVDKEYANLEKKSNPITADQLRKDRRILTELTKEMKAVIDQHPEYARVSKLLPDGYKQLPDDMGKYGDFAGAITKIDLYNDWTGGKASRAEDPDAVGTIWKNRYLNFVSWTKRNFTTRNPIAHAHNFWSNIAFSLPQSGTSPLRVYDAMRDLIQFVNTKVETPAIKALNDSGQSVQTFSTAELRILNKFSQRVKTLEARAENRRRIRKVLPGLDNFMDIVETGRNFANAGAGIFDNGATWTYQMGDTLFKLAKIIDEMDRGTPPGIAAGEAAKWFFDYSNVGPKARFLRTTGIAPFITYPYLRAPLDIELHTTAPWRMVPQYAMWVALHALCLAVLGSASDELKKSLNKELEKRPLVLPLPIRDEHGRIQWVDLASITPNGGTVSMASSAMHGDIEGVVQGAAINGGPVFSMLAGMTTGVNPNTNMDIYDKVIDDNQTKTAKTAAFAVKSVLPSTLAYYLPPLPGEEYGGPGYEAKFGTGTDKYGQPTQTDAQLMSRLMGFSIYPSDPVLGRMKRAKSLEYAMDQAEINWRAMRKSRQNYKMEDGERIYTDDGKRRIQDAFNLFEKAKKARVDYLNETRAVAIREKYFSSAPEGADE